MKNKYGLTSLVTVFFALLLISPVFGQDSVDNQYTYHHVVWGDTLSSISAKYLGSSKLYPQIAELNRLSNPNLIIAGSDLKIGIKQASESVTPVTVAPAPSAPVVNASPVESKTEKAIWHGLRLGAMYAGGGGNLQVSNDFEIASLVFNISGGAGFGKNYYMGNLQLSKEFGLPGDYRLGVSGVYAYYSKYIINVPWIPQSLDMGSNYGLGAYIAKDLCDWEIRAGYSPVLGPIFGIGKYL
jgi:hypothetical protein